MLCFLFRCSVFCFVAIFSVLLCYVKCCVLLLRQQIVAEQNRFVWGEEDNTWNKQQWYISIRFSTFFFHIGYSGVLTIMSTGAGCGSVDRVVIYQSQGRWYDLRHLSSIWLGVVLILRLSCCGQDTEPQVAPGGSGQWLPWQLCRHLHVNGFVRSNTVKCFGYR